MVKQIDIGFRRSGSSGLMHDSRHDVRALMQVANLSIEKINELVVEVNNLRTELDKLRGTEK